MDRRLAAILYADMVGYSRLVEIDKSGTIARQRAHRKELIDPTIELFKGRIVKTTDDGMLVEFSSTFSAVECAVKIQQAMVEREADRPEKQRIRYRIGLNVGDIVIDGDDILGDSVNIAARLEGLAEAGSICISNDVMRQVRGKLDAAFNDSGNQKVKNIAQNIHVRRWAGAASYEAASTPKNAKDGSLEFTLGSLIASIKQPTLAVLPFLNMSRNEDLEYFCDGLTESLITDLSRALRLSVAARNSSFAFKGQTVDIRDAAAKLGVRYLIEGSVQAMGSRMRINVQLIDSTTGDHIWADRFDRSTDDLFAAQDEVCSAILTATDIAISFGEGAQMLTETSNSEEALQHTRRAIQEFSRLNQQGFVKAQKAADIASSIDPDIYRDCPR